MCGWLFNTNGTQKDKHTVSLIEINEKSTGFYFIQLKQTKLLKVHSSELVCYILFVCLFLIT